jgi:hypothetical protein
MKVSSLQIMYGTLWVMLLLHTVVLNNSAPYNILAAHVSEGARRLRQEDNQIPKAYLIKSQDWGGWSDPKIYYRRMLNVQRHCGQTISFLDTVASYVVSASGGHRDRSASLRYPEDKAWRTRVFPDTNAIDIILRRIDTLNEFLIRNLHPGSYMRDAMRRSLPSKWGGVYWDHQDADRRYVAQALWNAPAAAAIAIVAALQQRIALAEGAILEELRREATPKCGCCWQAIAGLAIPISSYVNPGASVQATIGIAAYDRSANIRKITTSSGRVAAIKDGIVTWKAIAGPPGDHPVSGYIWIKIDTVLRKLPWTFSYTSGGPSATLILDKASTVYRGISNSITLNVEPGISTGELQLQVTGATVSTAEKGTYSIFVTKPGVKSVFARIISKHSTGEADTIGGLQLKVKDLPLPVATIGSSIARSIRCSELKNAASLSLIAPDQDLLLAYKIISYEFSYLKEGERKVSAPFRINGPAYTTHPPVQEYLQHAEPGDKIFIGDITAQEPGGRIIHPAPASFNLE